MITQISKSATLTIVFTRTFITNASAVTLSAPAGHRRAIGVPRATEGSCADAQQHDIVAETTSEEPTSRTRVDSSTDTSQFPFTPPSLPPVDSELKSHHESVPSNSDDIVDFEVRSKPRQRRGRSSRQEFLHQDRSKSTLAQDIGWILAGSFDCVVNWAKTSRRGAFVRYLGVAMGNLISTCKEGGETRKRIDEAGGVVEWVQTTPDGRLAGFGVMFAGFHFIILVYVVSQFTWFMLFIFMATPTIYAITFNEGLRFIRDKNGLAYIDADLAKQLKNRSAYSAAYQILEQFMPPLSKMQKLFFAIALKEDPDHIDLGDEPPVINFLPPWVVHSLFPDFASAYPAIPRMLNIQRNSAPLDDMHIEEISEEEWARFEGGGSQSSNGVSSNGLQNVSTRAGTTQPDEIEDSTAEVEIEEDEDIRKMAALVKTGNKNMYKFSTQQQDQLVSIYRQFRHQKAMSRELSDMNSASEVSEETKPCTHLNIDDATPVSSTRETANPTHLTAQSSVGAGTIAPATPPPSVHTMSPRHGAGSIQKAGLPSQRNVKELIELFKTVLQNSKGGIRPLPVALITYHKYFNTIVTRKFRTGVKWTAWSVVVVMFLRAFVSFRKFRISLERPQRGFWNINFNLDAFRLVKSRGMLAAVLFVLMKSRHPLRYLIGSVIPLRSVRILLRTLPILPPPSKPLSDEEKQEVDDRGDVTADALRIAK